MSRLLNKRNAATCFAGLALITLAACGGQSAGQDSGSGNGLSGNISIDGSSTVAPLSTVAAELFQEKNSGVKVTVGTSGTGGGFEKFCRGETDISNASRPIEDDEAKACGDNGVKYDAFEVANDALTVVVSKDNDWAKCLTVAQLKKVWEPGSKVKNWNEIDPKFPNEPLKLFGAGTDSGTFDYFTDAINGEEGASRTDYSATEDDNVTVQGVSGSKGGLGYFGFSYFEENSSKLNAVAIDSGKGCVDPSVESVQDSTYTPLGRPLFIYPSAKSLGTPEGLAFVKYYVEKNAQIATESKFIPLNPTQETELQAKFKTLSELAK